MCYAASCLIWKISIQVEGNLFFSEDHLSDIKESFLSPLYLLTPGISEFNVFYFGCFLQLYFVSVATFYLFSYYVLYYLFFWCSWFYCSDVFCWRFLTSVLKVAPVNNKSLIWNIKVRRGFSSFSELPAKQCGPPVYCKENGKVSSSRASAPSLRVSHFGARRFPSWPSRVLFVLSKIYY